MGLCFTEQGGFGGGFKRVQGAYRRQFLRSVWRWGRGRPAHTLPVYKKEKYSLDFFQKNKYELHDKVRSGKILLLFVEPQSK